MPPSVVCFWVPCLSSWVEPTCTRRVHLLLSSDSEQMWIHVCHLPLVRLEVKWFPGFNRFVDAAKINEMVIPNIFRGRPRKTNKLKGKSRLKTRFSFSSLVQTVHGWNVTQECPAGIYCTCMYTVAWTMCLIPFSHYKLLNPKICRPQLSIAYPGVW